MANEGFELSILDQARMARVLVAITVHFNPARLEFLAEVLRSLANFPVAAMDVVLVTNTFHEQELALIRRLCDETFAGEHVSIQSHGDLAHPFDLTWRHKAIIANEFAVEREGGYTHFIYLEDDIRLDFANFCYFVDYRDRLRGTGVLPSFLRVEYSKTSNGFVSTDMVAPINVTDHPHLSLGETILVNSPNPYIACFILDTSLAVEYVRARSFRQGKSRSVSDMDVRERAAMGLCHENVPESFNSRYVVPVSRITGMALKCAWISHLPNNYANDPNSSFGKIRMDSLFMNAVGDRSHDHAVGIDGGPGAGDSRLGQKNYQGSRRNVDRYMVFPNKIIEGVRWRLGLRR